VTEPRPPFPPFDRDGALAKVQAAEDAWNTRDPHRVSLAYTEDSVWRNRDEFLTGRAEIVDFLTRKWERELDYVLRKSLWGFTDDRIAVRFQYEWHDAGRQWFRSYGNELWEFDERGLMRRREASINDVPIGETTGGGTARAPTTNGARGTTSRSAEPVQRASPLLRGLRHSAGGVCSTTVELRNGVAAPGARRAAAGRPLPARAQQPPGGR
jgi:nuclear transport factor 2 (NTF2) superfamily protein